MFAAVFVCRYTDATITTLTGQPVIPDVCYVDKHPQVNSEKIILTPLCENLPFFFVRYISRRFSGLVANVLCVLA